MSLREKKSSCMERLDEISNRGAVRADRGRVRELTVREFRAILVSEMNV